MSQGDLIAPVILCEAVQIPSSHARAQIAGRLFDAIYRFKYFRLKDGTFLDLNAMDEWYEAAEAIYDSTGQEKLTVQGNDLILSQYKTMYLSRLLDMASLPIIQDESIRKAVRDITKPEPVSPEAFLPSWRTTRTNTHARFLCGQKKER